MMDYGDYLTVSQMAKLHHISRQTLIYYDRIGLFRPQITDDKGYRYYTYQQVNVLKEILFLKKLHLPLDLIGRIVKDQNVEEAIGILEEQRKLIDEEIDRLLCARKYVEERLLLYDTIDFKQPLNEPYLLEVEQRSFLAMPFHEDIRENEDELQVRFVNVVDEMSKYDLVPSLGFGVVIPKASLLSDLKASSVFVFVPEGANIISESQSITTLEPALCCCMYYYGRPNSNEKELAIMLAYIEQNGYEVAGDALDICLLDHVKYQDQRDIDFCSLQIPIRKKDEN